MWIDFVADSGDDVSVSEAVGRLMFAEYTVTDPDDEEKILVLPRGDLLVHGGDIAYPVATIREITRRVLDPWNSVIAKTGDKKLRPLFGIPGNHDWYDGLVPRRPNVLQKSAGRDLRSGWHVPDDRRRGSS